jgi:hypothetical protein
MIAPGSMRASRFAGLEQGNGGVPPVALHHVIRDARGVVPQHRLDLVPFAEKHPGAAGQERAHAGTKSIPSRSPLR